ncbi:MAG: TAXI family TRAP transporter solute-binding subunit, partial [Micromonosporaceae bacterium]
MGTSNPPGRPHSGGRTPGSGPGRLATLGRGRLRSHRRRSRWRVVVPIAALLVVATVSLSGGVARPPGPAYPPGPLPIATGDRTTVYYSYGLALLNGAGNALPELDPYLTVTPSDRHNVKLLTEGKAQLGFASAETIAHLPSVQTSKLATLARIYDDYLHLVVRRDGPIHKLSDLRGKRVSFGGKDSGAQRTAFRLLHAAGVDPESDLKPRYRGVEQSADAMRDGEIDAFFFFGGVPTTAVEGGHVGSVTPIRLIDLEDWLPRLRGYGFFYTRLTIPASAYG